MRKLPPELRSKQRRNVSEKTESIEARYKAGRVIQAVASISTGGRASVIMHEFTCELGQNGLAPWIVYVDEFEHPIALTFDKDDIAA